MISSKVNSDADVIVCGLATVDILTWPSPLNQPIGAGVLRKVQQIDLATGGCVSNAGVTLARLGISTAAVTCVGDDVWGRFLREKLESASIDCHGLIVVEGGTTSVSNVLVGDDSQRSFLFSAGVAAQLPTERIAATLTEFPNARWLLFGYYSLFEETDRGLRRLVYCGAAYEVEGCVGYGWQRWRLGPFGGSAAIGRPLLAQL